MPDQEVSALFPTQGIDATCEYGRQPDATAAEGVNVRSYDATAKRLRGGSRPGLSKHIDALVVGATPVWHLNFLVDPQAGALNADTDDQLPGYVLDPSGGGRGGPRYVPAGGGGRVPNRNIPDGSGPPQTAGYLRQSKSFTYGVAGEPGPFSLSFDQPPLLQSLVVAVATSSVGISQDDPANAPVSLADVRNSANDSYTQLGVRMTGGRGPESGFFAPFAYDCSVWYKYASAGSPDQTVRVLTPPTKPQSTRVNLTVLEFVGYAGGPVDVENASGTSGNISPGVVLMSNTANELVFFVSANQEDIGSDVTPGFTRLPANLIDDVNYVTVAYKTGLQLTQVTPAMADAIASLPWSALGVCFNHT